MAASHLSHRIHVRGTEYAQAMDDVIVNTDLQVMTALSSALSRKMGRYVRDMACATRGARANAKIPGTGTRAKNHIACSPAYTETASRPSSVDAREAGKARIATSQKCATIPTFAAFYISKPTEFVT